MAAILAVVSMVAAAVVFRDRLMADFVPPDRSYVGPNLVASLLWVVPSFVVGFFSGRRAVRRLHARHDAHYRHLERLARRIEDLHAKLDQRD